MVEPIGPTSHSFFSQRLRLHYVDWGNPGAPPVILVHGGQDHCRNWDWVAQDLRRDWHVIAPDLRGHGDSAFSPSGDYSMMAFVYDLAQLIHQLALGPVTLIAHSLGGAIALRYAGVYPQTVSALVAIEGLGPSPTMLAERRGLPVEKRIAAWIERERALAGRLPRRYRSIEDALARMQEENKHLTAEQARYLTVHGVSQNEDGTFSWKFDNYARSNYPVDVTPDELHRLWGNIACPTLLVNGAESWASDPAKDGRLAYFKNAKTRRFENAGHWVQHDQLGEFLSAVRGFI
ncbi:MAG TPA: alpha/beta hydrolase [Caulobacteraceae bacterium]|jgi:pimeloyl-ACP methyl ester carboxylesterase|nr:alpha/beta hydrolase [Caulobacteraceae bacterium]